MSNSLLTRFLWGHKEYEANTVDCAGLRSGDVLEGCRVGILVEQDFEDSELAEVVRAMSGSGAVVAIIGSGSSVGYRGMRRRVRIRVDATAENVPMDQLDALVIPGGHAPDKMRLHQSMVDLVKKADDSDKIVAAICHGPQLLISADIVRGRRVTSWPSIAIDLANAGATWVDEPVVQDRNIITARKPADLPRFNKVVIDALRKRGVPYIKGRLAGSESVHSAYVL